MKTIQMQDREQMLSLIRSCLVCYVGMVDADGSPYVVPFNFGYADDVIYLHGAQQGRKMDILCRDPRVSIVFSADHELRAQHTDTACSYSMKSRSVMVAGRVEFIEELDQKAEALNVIMRHYTGRDFDYKIPALKEVACFKVVIEKISGRMRGYC
jgi:uncharacterized protein